MSLSNLARQSRDFEVLQQFRRTEELSGRCSPCSSVSTQSISSSTSSRPNHVDYWNTQMRPEKVEEDMRRSCRCAMKHDSVTGCVGKFSFGDIMTLRRNRQLMDPNQEYAMRNKELLDTFETDPDHPKVRVGCQGVQYHFVCVSAYIIICGLPEKSTMRKWATITGQKALRPVGRPIERLIADKDIRDDMDTTEKAHALQWLIGWSELVADEDPTGSKYLKVIDLITYVEVWTLSKCQYSQNQ